EELRIPLPISEHGEDDPSHSPATSAADISGSGGASGAELVQQGAEETADCPQASVAVLRHAERQDA
ncbi:unnamed protein product, partial [Symbiodinium pilosum]